MRIALTGDSIVTRRGLVGPSEAAQRLFGLPDGEHVHWELAHDQPWSGFNYYEGDYTSTVAVNADLKQQMSNLPRLVAHESYPGHHTEHCRKEAGLVGGLATLLSTPPVQVAAPGGGGGGGGGGGRRGGPQDPP